MEPYNAWPIENSETAQPPIPFTAAIGRLGADESSLQSRCSDALRHLFPAPRAHP